MARLFIGIPLPDSYHEKARTLAKELSSRVRATVRWVPRGNAHITLLFLGNVDDKDIPHVKELLENVEIPAFQVRASGCGGFPSSQKPRVIYEAIAKGAKPCARLAAAIREAMAPFGLEPDDKPFTSHITLGRVKKQARDDWKKILRDASDTWPGFKVEKFILWKSDTTQEGAIYTPLAEYPLK